MWGRRSVERSVSVAMAMLLGLGGLTSMAQAASPSSASTAARFDELMNRAEQQRNAGAHRESANTYLQAYRALSVSEQMGLMGEVVIDGALAEYRQAQQARPEAIDALEEPIEVLEGYIDDRTRAHREGRADPVPARLRDELAQLRSQREQARPDAATSSALAAEMPRAGRLQDRRRGRGIDAVVVASGVVALAGGAGLIGTGARTIVDVGEEYESRMEALVAGGYSSHQRRDYQAGLVEWQNESRATAIAMVLGGSMLTVAGIGLTSWGLVRMRRGRSASKRHANVKMPRITPMRRGVVLSVDF